MLGTLVKWTALALVVILFLFNLGNFFLFKKVESLVSERIGETQAFGASTIAGGLRPGKIRSYSANPEGLSGRLLTGTLDEFRESGKLISITLLDTTGGVLYSSGGGYEKGEYFYYLGIDRDAFNSALSGIPSYTQLYESGGSYLRGAYSPVFDELGEIGWILGLEAGAEYYGVLSTFKRSLFLFFFLSLIVAIAVGGLMLSAAVELNRMEKGLVRASALSSIGEMAAGMAHEVRNPLAIIKGSAEMLTTANEKKRTELIGFIEDEVARIDNILSGYLSFARPAVGDTGPIFLGLIASDILERLRKRAEKSGVEIAMNIEDDARVIISESAIEFIVERDRGHAGRRQLENRHTVRGRFDRA